MVDQGQLGVCVAACGALCERSADLLGFWGLKWAREGLGKAGSMEGELWLPARVFWWLVIRGHKDCPQRDIALGQPCSIRTCPHTPAFNPKITYFGGLSVGLPAPGWVVAPGAAGSTGSPSSWPHSGRLGRGGKLSANNSKLQQCEAQVMLKAPPRQPRAERQENLLGAVCAPGGSQPKVRLEMGGVDPTRWKGIACVRAVLQTTQSPAFLLP